MCMGIASLISKTFLRKLVLPLASLSILFGSFSYTSNSSKTIDEETPDNNQEVVLPAGNSTKEKFMNSLNETEGFEGVLDLTLKYKNKDDPQTYSIVEINDGTFNFAKVGENKGLMMDVTVSYNDVKKGVYANYAGDVAYFNIAGLKYKYSDSTYKSVISKLISIFGVDVLKVPDSVYDFFDNIIGSDTKEIESSFTQESSSSDYSYKLALSDNNVIHFEEDENFDLTRIYSDELTINGLTLNFELKTERNNDELTAIKANIPTDSSSYIETYDSMELLRKINNIVSTERFGISLDGILHHDIEETNHHSSSSEDINMSMDFFGDIKNMDFNGEIQAYPDSTSENKNVLSFVSEKDEEQKTYIDYNNTMKVAMRENVFNDFLARVKEDFGTGMDILDKILSLLDEAFVSHIKAGRYEDILSSLKSLSNDGQYISLIINTGVYGLGNEGEIAIKIDTSNNNEFIEIKLNGVGLSGFFFNDTTIKYVDYQKKSITQSDYSFLEKIPTIYSQIYEIYSSPKFNLTIEGSLKDSNEVGITSIKGSANLLGHTGEDTLYEFDRGAIDLEFVQQIGVNDSEGNFSKLGKSKTHHISLDLYGLDTAYFHYYDPTRLKEDSSKTGTKGKMEIGPFEDVINIIKKIYNSKDERFAKWFKVIEDAEASNVIDSLKTGKFSPLLSKNLIVDSSFGTNESEITLSGDAFGLYEDGVAKNFTLTLKYEGSEVKSLTIKDLVFSGKTLNLTLTLGECDEDKLSILDHSTITMDFTGLSPLISDIYNTANLKTFHLTAENLGIKLAIGSLSIISINLDMDFRIYVDGSIVKVYGLINVPMNILYSSNYNLFKGDKYRTCVFYYDDIDPETGKAYEDNSGYAYLTYNIGKNKNEVSGGRATGSYKYHSSYFQDMENIMHFIFKDIIDIQNMYYNPIVNNITKEDTSEEAINYEEVISKFTYDEANRKWEIGLAVDVLLNNNAIKDFEMSISSSKSTANSCYVASSLELSATVLSVMSLTGTLKNVDLDVSDNWSSVNETYQTYIDAHRNDDVTYE